MPSNLIMELPSSLEMRLRRLLAPEEKVEIKLKGQVKEALICTDRRIIILKTGFMAGSTFGVKLFQAPYQSISSVDVNFGIMWGVFEVATSGNQYSKKSAWRKHGTDENASEAPNAVSLNQRAQAELFREACNYIMLKVGSSRDGRSGPVPLLFSKADELRKLSDLLQEGILSPEEFAAQKGDLMRNASGDVVSVAASEALIENDAQTTGVDAVIQRALHERALGANRSGSQGQPVTFGRRTVLP